MNAYLIGPTLGYADQNRPSFDRASQELLNDEAFASVTVADPDRHTLRDQVMYMLTHDAVVGLPGWELDPTAQFLAEIAQKCEIALLAYPDLDPVRQLQ